MEEKRKLINSVWNAVKKGNKNKIERLKVENPDKIGYINHLIERHLQVLSVYKIL